MIVQNFSFKIIAYAALAVSFVILTMPNALAQSQKFSVDKQSALYLPNIIHAHESRMTMINANSVEPPHEPMIQEMRFTKQDPPRTLTERIDRLVHGILHDVPPTYDHYGYEIRRYMKSILTPNDLNDSLHLLEKLRQARTARVILDYWRKELQDEMQAIEKQMESTQVTTSIRTMFRYNSGIINRFIPDLYIWIDRNIEFLEFLQGINGEFYISYPFYQFSRDEQKAAAKDLYAKREEALRAVIEYAPFRAMIY